MQNIIVEKPYEFIAPYRGTFWSSLIGSLRIHAWQLKKVEGVVDHEIRHLDRLRESIRAGHGILLTPNHPRTSDPLSLGWLTIETPCHLHLMASWHLFHESWLRAWAIRVMGGFSVNREGVDRQAINMAIDLLAEAKRPLVIFPEGATSRINDRLQAMLDGVAFIARAAAKKRARLTPPGKVVIHPIGFKYIYSGDIRRAADEVLTDIERRLTWHPQRDLPLLTRITKVGSALLSLKEIEYLGQPQSGTFAERLARMIDRLLGPIEAEWLGGIKDGPVVPRVRNLRTRILPDMVAGRVTTEERTRRWRQLADIYLAQQLSCYPPDYLAHPTAERVLEMIEKFEEDLTDKARRHGNLKVLMDIGEPIEVSPERDRKAEVDPLMTQIQQALVAMVEEMGKEAHPLELVKESWESGSGVMPARTT
ncbi:MAG: 1-acyl-sn-glycerol-3-phosphate acyltransferase [Pirellulaceae bacterium]|nr:1-acyl-sn-glycerol-3-phosphate acyltransferase [Pirellulaceae bacterium]